MLLALLMGGIAAVMYYDGERKKIASTDHGGLAVLWLKTIALCVVISIVIFFVASTPGSEDARGYIDHP